MINRRFALTALALAAGLTAVPSFAANGAVDGWPTFDQKAFDAAQAQGKPILVHITAPWCPYCKAQKPILSGLLARPEFKDVQTFEIDFDSQKDLLHTFDVRKQSTLIAFKGASEVGRSTGDTNATSLEALVSKLN